MYSIWGWLRSYNFALVVTCGLTRFTRMFPCTEHITGEETIKMYAPTLAGTRES